MRDDADLSEHFAEYATAAASRNLPPEAVEGAKKSVLDTIGVILGASGTEPAVRAVIDHVHEGGGAQESSILAFGGRVPAAMAAFAPTRVLRRAIGTRRKRPARPSAPASLIPERGLFSAPGTWGSSRTASSSSLANSRISSSSAGVTTTLKMSSGRWHRAMESCGRTRARPSQSKSVVRSGWLSFRKLKAADRSVPSKRSPRQFGRR